MANICITGINGLLGSATAKALIKSGHKVIGVGSGEFVVSELSTQVEYFQVKIPNLEELTKIFKTKKIDTVFHFAGIKYVGVCEENPTLCNEVNHLGTASVVGAMKSASVPHIVFASTYAVYDMNGENVTLSEDSVIDPKTNYGKSKVAAEEIITESTKRGDIKRYQILRYANIFGADETKRVFSPQNIVDKMVEAAFKNMQINIFGDDLSTVDGTLARDFVSLSDVVKAHTILVESHESGVFNIGTGMPTTLKQIIDMVQSVTKKDILVKVLARKDEPASISVLSKKAYQAFGWQADASATETIMSICKSASKTYEPQ